MIWVVLWLVVGWIYANKTRELIVSRGYISSNFPLLLGVILGGFSMITYYLYKDENERN